MNKMKLKTYTGKNLDNILNEIAQTQAIETEEINYKVIGESGFAIFKTIKVEAYTYKDCMETIEKYIVSVITAMGFDVLVDVQYEDNTYKVNIDTNNNSLIIGANGKNLYALETLVKQVLTNIYHRHFYVSLDVNDYFKNKEEKLKRFAYKIAAEVGKTKIDAKLDPMPNYDRKVIHKVLKDVHYVNTKSYGEGKSRYLIVHYDKESDLKHKKQKNKAN